MQRIFKAMFFIYFIIKAATEGAIGYSEIGLVLILAASVILREKYFNTLWLMVLEGIAIAFGMTFNPYFFVFFGILCFDFVAAKQALGIVFIYAVLLAILPQQAKLDAILVITICGLLSHMNTENKQKGEQLRLSFDKERKYSLELEHSKQRLVEAAAETVHIAEIKERNRIARELHDSIGHSLAGVLMILQAAVKLRGHDAEKSGELMQRAVDGIAEALTLVKNTVYNIKPIEEFGIQSIEDLVRSYSYCPVEFSCSGNFNELAAGHMEIILRNIKEALTNISKYSQADTVWITLERNSNFIRLMIRDNGIGCPKIKDSLGLSGMKERIRNVGGSITISGENGFSIVCVIPLNREVGDMLESTNSR